VEIRGRPAGAQEFSLDETLRARRHPAREDFFDPRQLRVIYYPELEQLVKELSERRRVCSTHLASATRPSARRAVSEPVLSAHKRLHRLVGAQRVGDHGDEASGCSGAASRSSRCGARQKAGPGESARHSWMRAASCRRPAGRRAALSAPRRPDYRLKYNPATAVLLPRMRRDEALVFKVLRLGD